MTILDCPRRLYDGHHVSRMSWSSTCLPYTIFINVIVPCLLSSSISFFSLYSAFDTLDTFTVNFPQVPSLPSFTFVCQRNIWGQYCLVSYLKEITGHPAFNTYRRKSGRTNHYQDSKTHFDVKDSGNLKYTGCLLGHNRTALRDDAAGPSPSAKLRS